MPGASLTAVERLALCDLFEELGPDATTLCEGWTTEDLAAHLVVRENDPLAAPGILLGGVAGRLTERAMERARGRGYHWMIDRLRGGPPWGPMRLAVVDRSNLMEWFVHHEDARRANGRPPRTGIDDVTRRCGRSCASAAGSSPAGSTTSGSSCAGPTGRRSACAPATRSSGWWAARRR